MKYWRRVAVFILKDDNGRILLQHRDKNDEALPDYWAFFGGGIEEGETPEQAVIREAQEELQIKPKLKFFGRYVYTYENKPIEVFVFIGKMDYSVEDLKKQQREGDDLKLFSFDELKKLRIWSEDMKILKKVIKNEE